MSNKSKGSEFSKRAWLLAAIDLLPLGLVYFLILYLNPSFLDRLPLKLILFQLGVGFVFLYAWRLIFSVYRQIWRFGSIPSFVRLLEADGCAGLCYCAFVKLVPFAQIRILQAISIIAIDLLLCVAMRLIYAFLYQYNSYDSRLGRLARPIVRVLTGLNIEPVGASAAQRARKIRVAVVGAGRVGIMLAEELLTNSNAPYLPVVFIDNDPEKIGRTVLNLPVVSDEAPLRELETRAVQEVIFAIPDISAERKAALYDLYKESGCKIKIYDYPLSQSDASSKPTLREFDVEDLLYRSQKDFISEETAAYYRGRTVMITGGGGSIGSELCRQIARMEPKKLIILDVYENGAYDIQQELQMAYPGRLDLSVEILSVTNREQLEKVFDRYRPEVVLHAAAHKHVPLMEHNVCEAVWNNVFGTLNVVETAEKFGVSRVIMISTDKAVNPTNVMGATKRMCEMIVLSHAAAEGGGTSFSCTRFGNVLGSNGSVIPLFKRQIAAGGPVTVTDRRIIRYFMTIPEASQLVLQSGMMARNGELFVLDMGKPVKIYDLAVNMIRLSGLRPDVDIKIVETGLRPGEKLYEELLISTDTLEKTNNELIFVERQEPLSRAEVQEKLAKLSEAIATRDDAAVLAVLRETVPNFKKPEEVNACAEAKIREENK